MDAVENLYFALGELVYAIAKADGEIQREEEETIHKIVKEGVAKHHPELNIADIIFQIMEKDNIMDLETSYKFALESMEKVNYKLTDELKNEFVNIVTKVAGAFPPVTIEEEDLITRFKKDIAKI